MTDTTNENGGPPPRFLTATERAEHLTANRSRKVADREAKRATRRLEQEERNSAVAARKLARKPTTQLQVAAAAALSTAQSLDDEIVTLAVTLTDRSRDLVLRRWGYKEYPPAKLEALGELYGITRERVRQITSGHDNLIKTCGIRAPRLQQAAAVLVASGGLLSTARFEAALAAAGIRTSAAALRALPALAESGVLPPIYFHELYGLWLDDAKREELFVAGDFDAVVATMRTRARRALRRIGAVSVSRLTRTPPLDVTEAGHLVWGDTPTTSISSYVVPHDQQDSVLSHAVTEMLAVTPTMTLDDLAGGLLQVVPRPIKLAIPVLATVVSHHPAFSVSGGQVSLVTPVTAADVLAPAEVDIISEMDAHGGAMTWNELRVALVTHGHTLAWLHALHQRPFLRRAGRRFYVLRGRAVPPDAASLVDDGSPRPREWVLAHVQWDGDTRCTLRYRITQSTLRGVLLLPKKLAVLTSPAAEEWAATSDGVTVGALQVGAGMIWSLTAWMHSAGATPGDHVALTVDLRAHSVDLALITATQALVDETAWAAATDRPLEVRGPLRYRAPSAVQEPRVRQGRRVYDEYAWFRLPADTAHPPAARCYRLTGALHPAYKDVLIVTFDDFPLPPDLKGASMGVIFRLPTMKGHRLGVAGLIEHYMLRCATPLAYDEAMQLIPNLSEYLWRKRCALAWREYHVAQFELLSTAG